MAMGTVSGTQARHRARALARAALDLLLPPLCAGCRAPVDAPHSLCAACWRPLSLIAAPVCPSCGLPAADERGAAGPCPACLARPPRIAKSRAALVYDAAARPLILGFKHADRLDLALIFARMMAQAGREVLNGADVLVPVPLHRWRLVRRRANQAAELARALARETGLPVLPRALIRTRATASQGAMVSARARRRNVAGAFAAGPRARVAGHTVVLIDDVRTTGATLEACARILLQAGAREVRVLTLARVAGAQDAAL